MPIPSNYIIQQQFAKLMLSRVANWLQKIITPASKNITKILTAAVVSAYMEK